MIVEYNGLKVAGVDQVELTRAKLEYEKFTGLVNHQRNQCIDCYKKGGLANLISGKKSELEERLQDADTMSEKRIAKLLMQMIDLGYDVNNQEFLSVDEFLKKLDEKKIIIEIN